ncbi:hypothetical protein BpHYR1_013330 [Brachionus plicatilis]|uniref:Uncharacterized protein n=1 Tax=Brachionus plicatilis TaxID=10195 RepID=A0A3M7QEQ3_BRAPC|nr:hypothetical protein BpHYR1_013330 [Brachionus plicatilis]
MLGNDADFDLYLQNVSKNADPVQTSIDLYHEINKFLQNIGGSQRYGEISYVIIPRNKNPNRSDYIAFVSFERTVVHEEVAKVLKNFHFNNVKIAIRVNDKPTSNAQRRENKIKFKTELDGRSKIKRDSANKRKRVDSPPREVESRPKSSKTVEANEEESCDSFESVVLIKEESSEEAQTSTSEQTMAKLAQAVEDLKQELFETRKRECQLAIQSALKQVKIETLEESRQTLLREREEAAELASKLQALYNKRKTSNEGPQKQ